MAKERRLQFLGKMENVPDACGWVVQVATESGLPPKDINHFELAVDEAVTNVIEHGHGGDGADKLIEIIVVPGENTFQVTIVDDAPAFNPLNLHKPHPHTLLDDYPDEGGGLGIHFIIKMMDEVRYAYKADKNHLIMSKKVL